MGQVLYRKHRPKKLAEVVGQEHVTKTLEEALKQGKISHAYLFTGPRGVGKTSIARILAHEINGLPYTDDSSHIDIIEIDAASNRRIDEIRELRDKVYVAPSNAKYKVYIIDEVHMLTREAFNALLKTLEEPPAHVIFILATTDAHKLPETIISRTQRYNFRPVPKEAVIGHLQTIAKQEKITIDASALELIAEHGEGSFRDSISLLDQASAGGKKVDLVVVQQLLGLPPDGAIDAITTTLASDGGAAQLMQLLNGLYVQGFQASTIAKLLGQKLRQGILNDHPILEEDRALPLLEQLIQVPVSPNPERFLEITLLKVVPSQSSTVAVEKPPIKAARTTNQPSGIINTQQEPPPRSSAPKPPAASDSAPQSSPESTRTSNVSETSVRMDESSWEDVLSALKKKHNTLYGLVRMAEPEFNDDGIRLKFAFAFHQKRVSEAANRQRLLDIIKELSGGVTTIECVFDQTAEPIAKKSIPPPNTEEVTPEPQELSTISNIFGGGELLES